MQEVQEDMPEVQDMPEEEVQGMLEVQGMPEDIVINLHQQKVAFATVRPRLFTSARRAAVFASSSTVRLHHQAQLSNTRTM